MNVRWSLILLVVASGCTLAAAPGQVGNKAESQSVFEMQELFESMRIPQIIVARDGTVLAFAKSCWLIRRSEDHGRTWSAVREVGPDATGSAIVDDNSGDVLVVSGRGYLYRSQDHGKTWKREDIVIKPNDVGHGTPDGVPVSLGASESGITLAAGKHEGRLLMPARIQPPKGNNAQEYWPYNYNTAIYSDDGGRT